MSLLEINNLHTYFFTRRGVVKAVDGIDLHVEAGRTLGVVGESGSGKSQTAMSILQLFENNQRIVDGSIYFNGECISTMKADKLSHIRGNDISIIFQDPMTSLNPVFTVEQQINEVYILHQHMKKKEASKHSLEMLKAVQIENAEDVLKKYPHQLSGGMSQRVMIAMALACQPKLLIADEPTTALDVIVQAEILRLMNDLKKEFQTSILFITHDLGVIYEMADDVVVMNNGRIVEKAPVKEIFKNPKHPYTQKLLRAFLLTDIANKNLDEKERRIDTTNLPYTFTWEETGIADPDWYEISPGHTVACTIK